MKWGESGWPVAGSQWEELPGKVKCENLGAVYAPRTEVAIFSETFWGQYARYTDQQWSRISAWASMRMQTLWRTVPRLANLARLNDQMLLQLRSRVQLHVQGIGI